MYALRPLSRTVHVMWSAASDTDDPPKQPAAAQQALSSVDSLSAQLLSFAQVYTHTQSSTRSFAPPRSHQPQSSFRLRACSRWREASCHATAPCFRLNLHDQLWPLLEWLASTRRLPTAYTLRPHRTARPLIRLNRSPAREFLTSTRIGRLCATRRSRASYLPHRRAETPALSPLHRRRRRLSWAARPSDINGRVARRCATACSE